MARSKYSQWYTSSRWRKRRATHLQREPLCRFCQKLGRVEPASIADHIEPHRGDPIKFWSGELQSLCQVCHSSVKQRMENGKVVQDIGLDGWPIRRENGGLAD